MRDGVPRWIGLGLLGLSLVRPLPADDYDAFFTLSMPAIEVHGGPEAGKEKDAKPPFAEVVAGADTLAGLFTLYHLPGKDQCWLELAPEQLGKDFLLSFTLESGLGGTHLPASVPYGHMVVRFDKSGERIRLTSRNLMFRAADERAEEMVARSYSHTPLASFTLAAQAEPLRGSWLIPLNEWFLSDPVRLSSHLKGALKADYRPKDELSRWRSLRSFPANLELGAVLGFATERAEGGWSVTESPFQLEFEIRASLSQLPEKEFQPRLSDPRVGYFETGWRLWGDDGLEDPMIRVANRWRLEKQDPAAALSEPVQPIVFWLENAVPEEYREVLRRGAELWNRAFEEAGFKNALVVKQMPDDADWDPADIRYNTIRWIASNEPSFGAMGPSQVNPFTGEILNADIVVEADMVRRVAWGWRSGIAPLGRRAGAGAECLPSSARAGEGLLLALQEEGQRVAAAWAAEENSPAAACRVADELERSAWQAGAQLAEAGLLKPGEPLPRSIVDQYLLQMIAHEVGHTLGLRHNFAASALLPFDQLWDSTRTQESGLVSSVMEYNGACVALDPARQGDYYTRCLGPYDRFAIQWGYTPSGASSPAEDARALQPLLARSAAEPALRYGTDEDAYDVRGWGSALDPGIRTFDLSSDELAWSRHCLALNRARLGLAPEAVLRSGDDPAIFRRAWERAFDGYWAALEPLPRYVGAYRYNRQPWGQGRAPLEAWPLTQQRQVLELLLQAALDPAPWLKAQPALDNFGPGWGWNFSGDGMAERLDTPLRERLAERRERLLADLYCPARLARAVELQARQLPGGTLGLDELFLAIRAGIWTSAPSTLESRDLQRIHVGLLTELLLEKRLRDLPADARLLARADLQWIRQRLAGWQAAAGDRLGSQHLQDLAERIGLALERERTRL